MREMLGMTSEKNVRNDLDQKTALVIGRGGFWLSILFIRCHVL